MDPAMAIEVSVMSRQRALDETIALGDSPVQEFYRDCTVLITGGSGFMGKQLIEKLLRSCDLSKVFVLMRPKKGKQIEERLKVIFQDPVFESLRKKKPDFEQKLVAIPGDAAEIRLGISAQDWQTITDEVDVIYHMAATTRFDEALKVATLINVRGTREALLLAKACKKLKSFVHVSTAYAHARSSLVNQEVYERFYESPIAPGDLISMAESMDSDRLHNITASLIQDWPNTYTFAKTVAEDLVRTMSHGLPICIVRPGIVIATYREPTPGWLDITCAYGASGVILGIGLGLLHVIRCNLNASFGLIPCDIVNNAIIAAGQAATCSAGGDTTKIYAVSSSKRNALTQGQFRAHLNQARHIISPRSVYYAFGHHARNKYDFTVLTWLLHLIPAYIVDFVCLLIGKKQRFVKIYNKMHTIMDALTYFTTNGWIFEDKNLENLYSNLSKSDKQIYNFDITSVDWREFILIWGIGIRKYIIKDGLKGTERAQKKQFYFKILHVFIMAIYIFCFWKLLSVFYYLAIYFT